MFPIGKSRLVGAIALVAVLAAGPLVAQQKDYSKVRGYVDKNLFAGLVSEDDVQIEVWLPGTLLQLVKAVDPELLQTDEDCKDLTVSLEEARKAWHDYQVHNRR